jgi:hypothetical protein
VHGYDRAVMQTMKLQQKRWIGVIEEDPLNGICFAVNFLAWEGKTAALASLNGARAREVT